jgi:hypothetical protein
MPAVSQAQRGFLAHKFGPAWMKEHHFDNPGKLPQYVSGHAKRHVQSPSHGSFPTGPQVKAHMKRHTATGC